MNRPDDAQPESAPRRWRESRWRHGDSPQVRGEGDAISNPGGVDGPRELSSAECLMVTSESDIEGGREEGGGDSDVGSTSGLMGDSSSGAVDVVGV